MNFSNRKVFAVVTLATLAVLGHWNFWSHGIYALGFNTTVFWMGITFLLWDNNPTLHWKKDWCWFMPLLLMALSFSLFSNPWLKIISCVVLPIASSAFYAYSQINNAAERFWGLPLIGALIKRSLVPIRVIGTATLFFRSIIANVFSLQGNHLCKRILSGLILLVPVAAIVLILLTSADENFARLIERTGLHIFGFLNWSIIAKVFCIFMMCVLIFSILHAWKDPYDFIEKEAKLELDDVIIGIVMGGILLIYLVFLLLQVDHILLATLPQSFDQTEQIVKSGFWQLFFLSILNVSLFFTVYKNTGGAAQIILRVFIIASGLLLLSAAWRMGMYVYWHGLSYEKFFASYTTLFALGVFVYLLIASFAKYRKDVVCFIVFAALWAYGVATVLPVERIIFKTNVQLSQLAGSRVDLDELKMLSTDVLVDVKNHFNSSAALSTFPPAKAVSWNRWVNHLEAKYCNRMWYEQNLSLIAQCP
ncbi:MAG: DUF4153 domain-containing protein [Leucothrix sp.]